MKDVHTTKTISSFLFTHRFCCLVFSLFFLFTQCSNVHSSLINPDLAPDMPGYEDFAEGCRYFEIGNRNKAKIHFSRAANKSRKPHFYCRNYSNHEYDHYVSLDACGDCEISTWFDGNGRERPCENVDLEYYSQNYSSEITYAIYRHAQFHLGLIDLQKEEFASAYLHFRKAIGFGKDEADMGKLFYRCFNIIDPSWIVFAALTGLHQEKNEAKNLINLAFGTLGNIEYGALDFEINHFRPDEIKKRHWKDWKDRGITQRSWLSARKINLNVAASIVEGAQGNLQSALVYATRAIILNDLALRDHIFPSETWEDFTLYSNRGVLHMQAEKYDEALLDFTKAIELNSSDALNYFYRAELYLFFEEYPKAFADYHQAIELNPHDPELYRQRALGYALSGSWDEAVADLKLAGRKENQINNSQNELGLNAFATGSFKKAANHFDQIIKLNPQLAVGYQNRAAAFFQDGQFDKALLDLQMAIQINPCDFALYQMRAQVLMVIPTSSEVQEREFLQEAISNLLNALELNATEASLYQNLAAAYSFLHDLDKASNCLEQLLALTYPEDHSKILKNLAVLYYEQGEFEKALSNCDKAILMACKEHKIYLLQGLCLFEAGQFEEAIASYEQALKAGCDPIDVYYMRAQAYFSLSRFEHALEDISKAVEVQPGNAEFYKLRGLIYLRMHQELNAYEDFRMALKAQSTDIAIKGQSNQISKSIRTVNADEPFFDFHRCMVLSIDQKLFYPKQTAAFDGSKIIFNLSQVNVAAFGNGLAFGLLDGGIEVIQEIGPFLAQMAFHPVETTQELMESLAHLIAHAVNEDWEQVFEALAPELKELFTTWDKIDDYEKGKLVGIFIGKNGVAALTAIGGVKMLSKLKGAVVAGKTRFSRMLIKTNPEIIPLPSPELIPKVPIDQCWRLPYHGGLITESQFHNEYAIARIVQSRADFIAPLEAQALKKTQQVGLAFETWAEAESFAVGESSSLTPRAIPPSMVELKITNPATQGINLVINKKLVVKNLNTARHILQEKHAWDKVLQLSGCVEKDIQAVLDFLEKNEIVASKYFIDVREFPIHSAIKNVHILEYEATISGLKINIFIQKNLATEELFLQNGWIVTK